MTGGAEARNVFDDPQVRLTLRPVDHRAWRPVRAGELPYAERLTIDGHELEVSPRHARLPSKISSQAAKEGRVGFANSGGLVFVDESAEQIATA